MTLDGVTLPLSALPERFAGLPVVKAPGPSADRVAIDINLSEGDLLLASEDFERRFLAPIEAALSRAIEDKGRDRFTEVSFRAVVDDVGPSAAALCVSAWACAA